MMLVPIEKRHFGGYGIILWITVWIVFPSHATDETITKFSCIKVEIDSHVGAEPEADHKVMMSTRVKNVRKADSMETIVNESLTSPEKKMRRAEGELLGESSSGSLSETAATPRPSNWDTMTKSHKSHWRKRNK